MTLSGGYNEICTPYLGNMRHKAQVGWVMDAQNNPDCVFTAVVAARLSITAWES